MMIDAPGNLGDGPRRAVAAGRRSPLPWMRPLLLGGLLWLLTGAPARAAAPERWAGLSDTMFKHYAAPEATGGTAFAQDGSGFVWMGTQSGLVRWDGYRLRRYQADAEVAGSLPDSFIRCLYVDPLGRLWAGTSSGGLARYDAAADNFVVVGAGANGLSSGRIAALAGDGAGGLWVSTGAGLDRIDARGVVQRGAGASDVALPENGVNRLLVEPGGAQWLGTQRGLLRRDNASAPLRPVVLGNAEGGAPHGEPDITSLLRDSAGVVWVGTRAQGAYRIGADGAARAVRGGASAGAALRDEPVMAIVEVLPGQIWLGTEGGGIVAVDGEGSVVQHLRHQAERADSLQSDDIGALFRERSGLIFVATAATMSVHDPRQQAVLSLLGASAQRETRLSVPSMLEMPDGRIWLGVVGGGIDVLDPARASMARGPGEPVHIGAMLPRGRVLAMAVGPGGKVYIGTQQGLYRSDAGGANVERLDVPGRSPGAGVWALAFDGSALWLGGQDGLWALDVASAGAGRAPALLRRLSGQLGDVRVTALLRGAGHDLWVGTHAGLVRVDTASGAYERLPTDVADTSRLPPGYLSSLLIDRGGRLWASTFGAGISVLERTDADGRRRFRRLSKRDGLPDNGVDKLLEDRQGALWASTDDGLARIDPRSYAVRVLQRAEGVRVQTYWTNSGLLSRAGELLFGGQSGLTVVLPERLKGWDYRAPMVVSEAQAGNRVLAPAAGRPATPLLLAPGERSLWVEFAALDYSAPERNRYQYRLDGVDSDWMSTDARYRRASYTNLAPGSYTLRLRGTNRDGLWSEPLLLALRVAPAWYQSWWCLLLAALAALGLLAALLRLRTGHLRRGRNAVQALLEQRSAELRDTQRQLEQLAAADPLTGLPNRRLFNDELHQLVAQAQRDGTPCALLLIDLDHFKRINDMLGHAAGDALLVAVALRLQQAVGQAGRAARLGGDEFAVLLTQTAARDSADEACARIVESLAQPVAFGGALMQVSASLGAAICPLHAGAADALYKAADVALHQAKRDGRNTWRWSAAPSAAGGQASVSGG